MKKLLLLLIMVSSISIANASDKKHINSGDIVRTNTECLSATSKENFKELNRVCNRKDENSLKKMINRGEVYVLPSNTHIKVSEVSFGRVGGTISSGQLKGKFIYVSSEFVSK